MKLPATVLTVRRLPDKQLIHAKMIKDKEEMCCLVYSSDLVSEVELDSWLWDHFGPDWTKNNLALGIKERYEKDGNFFIHWKAHNLPSIGRIQVEVEQVEVEIS
jgi:hypothetical protein